MFTKLKKLFGRNPGTPRYPNLQWTRNMTGRNPEDRGYHQTRPALIGPVRYQTKYGKPLDHDL